MSKLSASARITWFTAPALLIAIAGRSVSTTWADNNLHEQLSVAEKFTGDLPKMRKGKGDIAAAFLTITPQREKKVSFASGGKLKVSELVVTNKEVKHLDV